MSFIRKLIYAAVFVGSTLSFIVLFQSGWSFQTFPEDFKAQIEEFKESFQPMERKKDASDQVVP